MRIKDAPNMLDMSNSGTGESTTFKEGGNRGERYTDYEEVKTNNLFCSGASFSDLAPAKVCPTDGAPFEVFTTVEEKDFNGDYFGIGFGADDHHTANGQMRHTYRHDLDNTTITYRACDDDKIAWAYSRVNFVYKEEMFNI